VKILLIEDEVMLNNIIAKRLRLEQMMVDCCFDGEEALEYLSVSGYDAVIVDIMMPKLDGLGVVEYLRKADNKVPVLFLTAKDSLQDKVAGLNIGGDDYLVKPFEFDELIARIYALVRRSRNQGNNELRVGPLRIDTQSRQIFCEEIEVPLTAKKFDLLYYLASNSNAVLTRQQIFDHIWEYDYESSSNLIDVYIKELRKSLDHLSDKRLIHTVRGVGYMFKCE
jgi:Response regulators consisting of a CheY-like receiver domain and a winged-helix DNA-binding domain